MLSRGDVGAVDDLADLLVVLEDDDPLAEPDDLLELGGDEDDGHPAFGELGDGLLDLGLGADVDAAGRLVEDEQVGVRGEPAAEQHLLLVAAGEVLMGRSGSAGRTLKRSMYVVDDLVDSRGGTRGASQPRRAWTASTRFSRTVRSPTMPSSRRFSVE